MLYSRDNDFDVDEWRNSLESARSSTDKLTLDTIFAFLPGTGSMPKNTLIEKV